MKRFYTLLGPGILFAAAAVGVSHLVQSTRAGAEFGLAMLPVLVLVCIAKYPSLLFGLLYPAHTGRSLINNYRSQGWWALGIFVAISLFAMWFILAAVAVTTAGMFQALVGGPDNILLATAAVLGLALVVLMLGQYSGLEHVSKVMLGLLAVLLPVATFLALPEVDFAAGSFWLDEWNVPVLAFAIALTGWMPIPLDASVLSSTWVAARIESTGKRPTDREASLDFNVGYVLAMVFAICFVLLGAGVIHSSGESLPQAAGPFAARVIGLFTAQIGDWSYYLIAVIAFVTMFSTLLTVLDGQLRIVTHTLSEISPRVNVTPMLFRLGTLVYALGGLSILACFMEGFTTFISFVTSLGFLIAPIVIVLNHRAMFHCDIAPENQPGPLLYWWSIAGGVVLGLGSLCYFYLVFFS